MKTTFFNHVIGTIALMAVLLSGSPAFAASDYLLQLEGVEGECEGKIVQLVEGADGSFSATNIPSGTYKLVYKPNAPVTGADPSASAPRKRSYETVKFEYVVSPRDAASGLATGKRQHKPMMVVKELARTPIVTTLGRIVVGDLDGDGLVDQAPPSTLGTKGGALDAPVKAGYDLKLNKKV